MPNTPSSIGVSMKPGTDRVGADAGAAVVDREVLGEDHDRALRRVVRASARGAFEPFDARDRDDAAALAVDRSCFEHPRDRVLRAQERAGEIDVEHALPLVAVEQVRGTAAGDTGRGTTASSRPCSATAASNDGRDRVLVAHVDLRRTSTSGAPSGTSDRCCGSSRSKPTTRAPSAAKRCTHASPMPDAAPVTSMHLARQSAMPRILDGSGTSVDWRRIHRSTRWSTAAATRPQPRDGAHARHRGRRARRRPLDGPRRQERRRRRRGRGHAPRPEQRRDGRRRRHRRGREGRSADALQRRADRRRLAPEHGHRGRPDRRHHAHRRSAAAARSR